jgi:hypothetical protein
MQQTKMFKSFNDFRTNENFKSRRKETDAERFKRWFGNSKVVDYSGEPIVWFVEDSNEYIFFENHGVLETEHSYGQGIKLISENQLTLLKGRAMEPETIPCYVSVKNPFRGTDEEYLLLKNNGVDVLRKWIPKTIKFLAIKERFGNIPFVMEFLNIFEKIMIVK